MKTRLLLFFLLITTAIISSCSSDDNNQGPIQITIDGATIAPDVGGPNQGNQVYIDLSTSVATSVKRDTWDLGFYSGSDFRVVLNGSVYMAAGNLNTTDIDAINSSSPEVTSIKSLVRVGSFSAASTPYTDNPNGDITDTAIDEISITDNNNKVYLVNLGDKIGTDTPSTGSVDISDGPRGWMKIRVLRNENNYILQYADIDATTHKQVTIAKSSDYNFTFFSLVNNTEVSVEPKKSEWDVAFTVFSNEIRGYGPYGYADFVVNNIKADAKAYMIDTNDADAIAYSDFSAGDVDNSLFTADQRSIGSKWRNGGGPGSLPSLKDNVYFVVNDANGNLYKIKFLALVNADGVRGYPEFEYKLLN